MKHPPERLALAMHLLRTKYATGTPMAEIVPQCGIAIGYLYQLASQHNIHRPDRDLRYSSAAVYAFWKKERAKQKPRPVSRREQMRRQMPNGYLGAKTNGGSAPTPEDLKDWRDLTWALGLMPRQDKHYKQLMRQIAKEFDRVSAQLTQQHKSKGFTIGPSARAA